MLEFIRVQFPLFFIIIPMVNILLSCSNIGERNILQDKHLLQLLQETNANQNSSATGGGSTNTASTDPSAHAATTTATTVYGQPDLVSSTSNLAGNGLKSPAGVCLDSAGTLVYIADKSNHRVVVYSVGGSTAISVYGQPNYTSGLANQGSTANASTLSSPTKVIVDSSGYVYIADSGNNRVLVYTGPPPASYVYGQGASGTTMTTSAATTSSYGLSGAKGISIDSSNNILFVADGGNSRAISFQIGNYDATSGGSVYGQGGSFVTSTFNYPSGTATNSNFNYPVDVVADSSGGVYVADTNSSRILYFPSGSTIATRVYGQPDYSTTGPNTNGLSASSLYQPQGLALDDQGNLYISELGNNRVLFYPSGSTTGTVVYGQADFASGSINAGASVSATGLYYPSGLYFQPNQGLYVADTNNNRVLLFPL